MSRNVRAPSTYSFVRPQAAFASPGVVDFAVLETSGGLVAEPASRSRCAHSPVQVSRNVKVPLSYSFVRPQVAGDEAVFDFVSAVEVVDFVVLERSGGLVAEPSRACFASCFASYFAFASDAAASARYMALLT